MLTFDEFVKKYTGVKNVGNTPQNKGECVGLVAVWVDNLNLTHIWGDAKDLYANASTKEWVKILNTPKALPIRGDILVWKGNSASAVGHTGLFVDGNLNDFHSFDQNYPTGSAPKIVYHTYDNLLGWLRPINNPFPPENPPQGKIEALEKELEEANGVINRLQRQLEEDKKLLDNAADSVKSLNEQLVNLRTDYSKLKADYEETTGTLSGLLTKYNETKTDLDNALKKLEELNQPQPQPQPENFITKLLKRIFKRG